MEESIEYEGTRKMSFTMVDVYGTPLFSSSCKTERVLRQGTGMGSDYHITEYRDCTLLSSVPVLWKRLDRRSMRELDEFNHALCKGERIGRIGVIRSTDGNYLDFYIPSSTPSCFNFVRADMTLL